MQYITQSSLADVMGILFFVWAMTMGLLFLGAWRIDK